MPTTIVTPTEALSIDELIARAESALARGDPTSAAADFERAARADPDGDQAPSALLRCAEAEEALGDQGRAARTLEQVARRYPGTEAAREALVRAVRLLAFLEEWDRAGRAADQLLRDPTALGPIESLVAHGGRALSLVERGEVERASLEVERGRSIIDAQELDRAGRVSRDVAQLFYALGEVRRLRAEAIRFDPMPPDFGSALERRCQALLDAQSAYSTTMRAYDAHWSAMAGFRTGQLYQSLHRDLMRVPPPAGADTTARRELFEGAMRLRYSILLEKGLAMIDHTLAMTARTGEASDWANRAEVARTELRAELAAESRALDRLPYSRAELEAALAALAKPAGP